MLTVTDVAPLVVHDSVIVVEVVQLTWLGAANEPIASPLPPDA
jgi:hypothetical protein